MPFIPLWLDVCIAEGERSIVEMTKKGKKRKKNLHNALQDKNSF